MTKNVQALIQKIQTEGFEEAEKKAQAIEEQAKVQAQAIIDNAQKQAEKILADAQDTIEKKNQAFRSALEQTARNVLLTLKQDIQDLLKKVIAGNVQNALSGDKLKELVGVVVKQVSSNAQLAFNADDLKMIQEECLSQLASEIKSGVTFVSRRDRSKGLTISFDQQQSCFDLTEEALVEYFASLVSEELASLLRK